MKDRIDWVYIVMFWACWFIVMGSMIHYSNAHAANVRPYIEGGVSFNSYGCPEYCGTNPLGNFGGGLDVDAHKGWHVEFYVQHTSSIPDHEQGHGLNQAGVKIRKYFGEE
jgi:hypothetical protein